jgi:hypothetical protein
MPHPPRAGGAALGRRARLGKQDAQGIASAHPFRLGSMITGRSHTRGSRGSSPKGPSFRSRNSRMRSWNSRLFSEKVLIGIGGLLKDEEGASRRMNLT